MRHCGADVVHLLDVPALQWCRAFNPPLVDLEGRAVGVEALDAGTETVLEVQPAHLAVADDVEAGALLQRHRILDRRVLDGAKVVRADLALVEPGARLLEAGRAQQAADDVGADRLEIVHEHVLLAGKTLPQRRNPAQAAQQVASRRRGAVDGRARAMGARSRWSRSVF